VDLCSSSPSSAKLFLLPFPQDVDTDKIMEHGNTTTTISNSLKFTQEQAKAKPVGIWNE
jgi:hypothetical protein